MKEIKDMKEVKGVKEVKLKEMKNQKIVLSPRARLPQEINSIDMTVLIR